MQVKKISKLILSVVICELVGGIGAIFTTPAIQGWYSTIQKPSFNPPNWLFGPVWTSLFFLMGVSLYFILEKDLKDKEIRRGLGIFVFQFVLNVLWSFIFFYLQKPFYAFLEIIVLWFAILATIIQFQKIDKKAAYLLWPYLLWVTIATILNFSVWRLNL